MMWHYFLHFEALVLHVFDMLYFLSFLQMKKRKLKEESKRKVLEAERAKEEQLSKKRRREERRDKYRKQDKQNKRIRGAEV